MKSNVRKRFALPLLTMAVTAGLLGCGGADPAPAGNDPDEIGGSIRFTWWGSESRNEHTNAVIDLFEQEYAVDVEGEPIDFLKYFERLNVQAAGGNMPCVTQMLTFALNDYTDNDLLLDLSDTEVFDLSPLDEGLVDSLRSADGSLYMAPYGIAPSVLVFNEAMASEYGIELPSGDLTWDEYFVWLREAQQDLPEGVFTIDYPYNTPVEVVTYLGSLGPVFEDGKAAFTAEAATSWFATWKELTDEGVVLPGERISDYTGSHEDSSISAGVTLTSPRPANAIVAIEDGLETHGMSPDVGYRLLPVANDGSATDLLPINGLSIPKNCDNTAAALAFIDHWINDADANQAFAANNGAPTVSQFRQDLLEAEDTDEATRYMVEIADAVVSRGNQAVDLPPGFQATFLDTYRRLSISVLTDAMTPEAAGQELVSSMS